MVENPVEEKRWTIFLSHDDKDKSFADWLYSKLRSADLTVWYDKNEILVGDAITTRIAEGLQGSELLIVVISQRAMKSNWMKAVLESKILQQLQGQDVPILPLTLDNTNTEAVSFFLKGIKWIRFPRKGSDETFRELLRNIEIHLQQRGLLKSPHVVNRSTVQPALQNPFGMRGGVEPERFVVPEILVRVVTEDILKKQSISIIGARMMGKTSLLKFLSSPLCQVYYQDDSGSRPILRFVHLDLQEHADKTRDNLLPVLAQAMSELLPTKKQFQGCTHEEALDWIKCTIGKRHVGNPLWILIFDEFDRIVELNGLDKILFDELRSLPQHYSVCYVIASCRKLIDLPLPQGASTSPFFNFLKEHFLTVWNEQTVKQLMFKPRGKELGAFNEVDFTLITKLTASHPLLLQIGCYHLFNMYRAVGNNTLDHDQMLDSYMQEAESVYHYYLEHEINDVEREWLNDCWQALCRNDSFALQELQSNTILRKNYTICARLAKLGFVLGKSASLDIPLGLRYFLERS
jgi:TIR domain